MVELIYVSAATRPIPVTELREILGKARQRNRAIGVTGLLLHADGSFLQVLEGPEIAVDELFSRIERDPRHGRVLRLLRQPIEERSFPSWRMGFEEPVSAMRTEFLGFTRVLQSGESELPEGTATRVRSLVSRFIAGRWRQKDALPVEESSVRLR